MLELEGEIVTTTKMVSPLPFGARHTRKSVFEILYRTTGHAATVICVSKRILQVERLLLLLLWKSSGA